MVDLSGNDTWRSSPLSRRDGSMVALKVPSSMEMSWASRSGPSFRGRLRRSRAHHDEIVRCELDNHAAGSAFYRIECGGEVDIRSQADPRREWILSSLRRLPVPAGWDGACRCIW